MLKPNLLLFSLWFLHLTHARIIHYNFGEDNDERVNECIINAMDQLMEETCLLFERNQNSFESILFLDSGHCSWQETNKTVHLGISCINDAMCSQIIARALTQDRTYPLVSRTLNLRFNCTDKCITLCENGGTVTSDCKCECGYGFTGELCENLLSQSLFTDSSCGSREDNEEEGTISLSTFPSNAPKQTFCQWLIKADEPWKTVEFELLELDMDNENLLPGQKCGDSLVVFGSSAIQIPIPCNNEANTLLGRKYRSNSNWLLIELRGNAYALHRHKGPLIRYNIVSDHIPNDIRTFSSEQVGASAGSISTIWTLFIMVLMLNFAH